MRKGLLTVGDNNHQISSGGDEALSTSALRKDTASRRSTVRPLGVKSLMPTCSQFINGMVSITNEFLDGHIKTETHELEGTAHDKMMSELSIVRARYSRLSAALQRQISESTARLARCAEEQAATERSTRDVRAQCSKVRVAKTDLKSRSVQASLDVDRMETEIESMEDKIRDGETRLSARRGELGQQMECADRQRVYARLTGVLFDAHTPTAHVPDSQLGCDLVSGAVVSTIGNTSNPKVMPFRWDLFEHSERYISRQLWELIIQANLQAELT